MQLNEYCELFKCNKSAKVEGLCGRIIRGTEPMDFVTLTDNSTRKWVMLMGPDGLKKIMDKTGYGALIDIGYEPEYIVRKVVDEENQFKLVVFSESDEIKLATWDNVAEIVTETYPDIAIKLYQNLDMLKQLSFEGIENGAGFDFSEVDKIGVSDGRFMTFERFCDSDGGVIATRAFLYFSVHLRELFSGDGYTYDASGNRRLMEYIVPNKPIDALGNSQMLDMLVVVP